MIYLQWIWALPITVWGFLITLPFLALGQLRVVRLNDLVLEMVSVEGRWYERTWMKKWAGFCTGAVIVYRHDYVGSERTEKHERQHAKQCYWFGIFQPIAYFSHCLFIWFFQKNKHAYLDNWFERDARRAAGQPVDIPPEQWFEGPDDRWPWW